MEIRDNEGELLYKDSAPTIEMTLRGALEKKISLKNAYLRNISFSRESLKGADLQGANLINADLERSDFKGANLEDALFINADLEGACLDRANIENTQFQGARLKNASINDASVNRLTDFSNADLRGAFLIRVNLKGVSLKGAILNGAYITKTKINQAHKVGIYCKWTHGITDGKINVGCESRTAEEWKAFFKSDDIIETRRGAEEFTQIKAVVFAYIAYLEILKNS